MLLRSTLLEMLAHSKLLLLIVLRLILNGTFEKIYEISINAISPNTSCSTYCHFVKHSQQTALLCHIPLVAIS